MTTRRTVLKTLAAGALLSAGEVTAQRRRRLALIAGKPSHPTMMHEYRAGLRLLQRCLQSVPGLDTTLHAGGWPEDPAVLSDVDALCLFMDGGEAHAAIQKEALPQVAALVARGVGLGCLHYAVEVPTGEAGRHWQRWIGGYYEHLYSVNPMWEPEFAALPVHPITRGVRPFCIRDEWYFNMRFRPEMEGVTPILTASPSDAVRGGPYVYPAGPYDHVVAASGRPEVLLWCVERPDGGRGFGFTGGHFHLNWGNDDFRKVVLNALVWLAQAEVLPQGVESRVTEADLYCNLDDKPNRPDGPPRG
jgi:hypothetical protein